jgi:peroxiredoxin Q/BCP
MLGASAEGPLAVGSAAPDFELASTGGGRVRLSALLAEGPVALYFYPGDFTPG